MYKQKKSVGKDELVRFLVDLTAQIQNGCLQLEDYVIDLPGGAVLEVELEEEDSQKLEVKIKWFLGKAIPEKEE
ncbi:amphi-Trp domain-containing protein [Desulfothermobacter acidiphilus]|uniref:amphi-Trp domain-containing protein n=1 Tax=Desulfothermobacter acidiphilus TaxID=1938353 RepID=UPI003F888F46